ncbi:hypothetical protein SKUN_00613 [Spiroplasma kunkelii CR2-3x]|uniref:Uncharacterized protein n=1 Tax=Spiroplasma kunkelii CR2-3x TaxID=273035 RepID=A0A0K2JGY8_SPIKU|nr:hypothetical protein [Spiroplasma kunkelii]ALA97506.1 hypothetical protein SKUN_00613 [Spiroplasma kunkelii CR2-3x]
MPYLLLTLLQTDGKSHVAIYITIGAIAINVLFSIIALGIAQVMKTIIGYNYGAKNIY